MTWPITLENAPRGTRFLAIVGLLIVDSFVLFSPQLSSKYSIKSFVNSVLKGLFIEYFLKSIDVCMFD